MLGLVHGPAAAVAMVIALAPVSFRGCGGTDDVPPGGRMVPFADGGACLSDDECEVDSCMDVRCLAGTCTVVGPTIDVDGDGDAPPPCGTDCDDRAPQTHVGASELCDGQDNDCDGDIDEGAPRTDASYELASGDRTSLIVPWGPGFLITEATASVLWGLPVAVDGTVGSPVELMRLTMGTRFADVAAAGNEGQVLFVTTTDFGATRYLIVEPTVGASPRTVEGPASMPTPADVSGLRAMAYGSGFAIGYDATTPEGPRRLVTTDPMAEPRIWVAMDAVPATSFGFATDGTHLVVSDDRGAVHFFSSDGVEVATHAVEGLSAKSPLATLDGAVAVAAPDAFDVALGTMTAAGGLGTTSPAPFGDAADVVRLVSSSDLVLVARTSPLSTSVQPLRMDLVTYEGSLFRMGGPGAMFERLSVADRGATVAALGALSDGTVSLRIMRGCAD